MEPWVVVAITAGIDVVVCALFAVILRPCVDKDGNNRIGLNELPQWAVSLGPVVDGGGFYNLGTLTLLQTLLEAFAFSATYGLITVLTCNVLFIRLDETLGSILTVYTVFQAMQFQCTYSTNGVHVATGHIVHFVYYACGFLPLYFYRRSMATWLVAALVAVRLVAHTALKFYVWPKYPSFSQIYPKMVHRRDLPGEVEKFAFDAVAVAVHPLSCVRDVEYAHHKLYVFRRYHQPYLYSSTG
ncbi:unnamed protein product [Symbiodinium sp. KB8]|nr:unnamed protein product [Symbiodinium sp. KB8]